MFKGSEAFSDQVFRHFLRLILLCAELAAVTPPETTADAWQAELRDLAEQLTISCRAVDPASTDEIIEQARAADVISSTTADGSVRSG